MTTDPTGPAGRFTGFHMLLVAFGFFGVIIAVNVSMAIVAMTSWTGLVVENSYVASQEFETKRLAHEQQMAAGWEATLTYLPGGVAKLVVVDAAGKPVDLGDVTLQLNRPVGGHDDQLVSLGRLAAGGYAATVKLGAGMWEALVTAANTPLGPFELQSRFKVEEAAP